MGQTETLKGVILCAGRGTRLQPLTYSIAKPLMPVANKPALQTAIEAMRQSGIKDIALVVSANAKQVSAAFGNGETLGVHLTYVPQYEPKGTGHAVEVALPFIGSDPFVLYLGDNLFGDSLTEIISTFQRERCNAVIGVKEVPNPQEYGVVCVQGDNVMSVVEKPSSPPSNLALSGLFVFDPRSALCFRSLPLSPRAELELTDGIKAMVQQGLTVKAHRLHHWWVDIGNVDNLLVANKWVLATMSGNTAGSIAPDVVIENSTITGPVSIASRAVILDSQIGPNTSIGSGAIVQRSRVEDSIILQNSSIVDAHVTRSVIGEEARIIGNGTRAVMTLVLANKSEVKLN